MNTHYRTRTVATGREPLVLAATLAASGRWPDHVAYESPNGHWFAGGIAAEIVVGATTVRRTSGGRTTEVYWHGDPLELVREFLGELGIEDWRAYGWAAFELSYAFAGVTVPDDVLLHLFVPETEVRLTAGKAEIRALRTADLEAVEEILRGPVPAFARPERPMHLRHDAGAAAYRAGVADCVREIREGALQKVILSRVVPVPRELDFPASYVVGRRANTPARSYLLDLGGLRMFGFSQETVVEVDRDGSVSTQPLAGTRALTGHAHIDRELRDELLADLKELHEHAISVKVAMDDLAGPCEPGTVMVAEYLAVKERGTVQHLASRVVGKLADGGDAWDAFAAVFPAVTASGVPRRQAYETIRHREPRRGPYSGAVLSVGHDGSLDAALVLRSAYAVAGETWLRAGAGIVGQSTPEREFEETMEKLGCVAANLVPLTAESTVDRVAEPVAAVTSSHAQAG